MPRNHHPGASTLRNRIRITNKTRLRIHQGNLEADPLLVPDEDEHKHHLTNLVAGVDAEDAQEHHLQAVLSASQQNVPHARVSRAGDKSASSAVYIPTPDSTGIVDNYADIYLPDRWKDPANNLFSSSTVEELCKDGLAGGFAYYMDERDKEWLEKNNEEARGEGTTVQGAVSPSTTRTSARSAKAKGKEPEASQPPTISEDEFELVMGLLEKITHEKTEYLHHGLENGMAFPAFSDYQETFSSPLLPPTFASFVVPSWIPPSTQLLRVARTVYPHWKERRLERGGHRIIPILNFDESDTPNESYVCFRRREIKSVRKTRASQASSSDKLLRLQHELAYPLDMAKTILTREIQKKESLQQSQQIWDRRMALVDLKRKFPTLNDKGDEELLIDKEKPKKTDSLRQKQRPEPGPLLRPEVAMRPTERSSLINKAIEATLSRQKEQDQHWEDQIDNPYQPPLIPYPSRLYKYVPVKFTAAEADGKPILQRQARAVRLRRGRGGRMFIDRRGPYASVRSAKRRRSADTDEFGVEMDDDMAQRMAERWRFDSDDAPVIGPDGSEEHNRTLVDDYSEKYLRHSMTLLMDVDQYNLVTDAGIPVLIDNRQQNVVPFRLGMPPQPMRPRSMQPPQIVQPPTSLPPSSIPNPTPVAVPQQLKKVSQPPAAPPLQMRISSNGGMRPPSALGFSAPTSIPQTSPSTMTSSQPTAPPTNGISRAAINISHVDATKPDVMTGQPIINGISQAHAAEILAPQEIKVASADRSPVKQPVLHPGLNGYSLAQLAGQNPNAMALAQFALQQGHSTLTPQQIQTFRNALVASGQDLSAFPTATRTLPLAYPHNLQQVPAGANLKLSTNRQVQWVAGAMAGVPKSTVPNSVNVNSMESTVPSGVGQVVPARVPSATGTRPNGVRIPSNGQLGTHTISPHPSHTPSPILSATSSLGQAQSPPRVSLTPTLTKASPSLQHPQPTNSKSGY